MSRRTSENVLPLRLPDAGAASPAYRALYEAIRQAILAGRLKAGTKLPGSRELARQHGCSRGTVVAAFEVLLAEGYVEGRVGSGTYVASTLPDDLLEVARSTRQGAARDAASGAPDIALSAYARRVQPFSANEPHPVRAFRADLPALDLFPTALWARLASRRARGLSRRQLLGCEPLGLPALREAVTDYLATSRGVRAEPGQVAIVSGVQEALDLVTRLLIDPGARVAVEDPGYQAAAFAFEAAGAKVVAVPVDAEGLVVDRRRLRGARLVYVTPAHQYPLGITMSLPRRLALLHWARAAGAFIFEDDYDSEYRYSGRPAPALQGLDDRDSVIFAGSFNKVLFPSLRMGYVVLPPVLVEKAAASRSLASRHRPLFEQLVLLDFLAEGHFGRHLRRMREIYGERLATLLEAARGRFDGRLELSPIEAGLQTSARLLGGGLANDVAKRAAAAGVEVRPLARHYREGRGPEALLLGFAAVDPGEIRRGVRDLAAVLDRGA